MQPSRLISRRHIRRLSKFSTLVRDFQNGKGPHLLAYQNAPVDIHPEVEDALRTRKPVVALESTIITHGMPQPINAQTSFSLEKIVRSTGSVPATIGIIGGRVKIGLGPSEIERLAEIQRDPSPVKVSRRDVGAVLALKRDGGTTCSATLIFAALAGIKVFATGGLGGVHQGGETTMDISADLQELSRCPVGLVSAGVKSILDIGRTLEYLETLGVPVVSYGQTDDFPAFYSPRSGFKSPWRVDDPRAAAEIIFVQEQLGMTNGVLFGVPIPDEYESMGTVIQVAVEQAVMESEQIGVNKWGKEATPWLLKRVGELTNGSSLINNIALIENTALVGGQIACQLAKIKEEQAVRTTERTNPVRATPPEANENPIVHPIGENLAALPEGEIPKNVELVVIGAAAVDIFAQMGLVQDKESSSGVNSTTPGSVSISFGGVSRNIAEAAHRILRARSSENTHITRLISAIGNDFFGHTLKDEMRRLNMRVDGLMVNNACRSAVCNMFLDQAGNLTGGVADMDIVKNMQGSEILDLFEGHRPSIVVLDGNSSPEAIATIVGYCHRSNIPIFYEPTSVIKSTAILLAIGRTDKDTFWTRSSVTFASPNLLELRRLHQAVDTYRLPEQRHHPWRTVFDSFELGSQFKLDVEGLSRRSASDMDLSKGTLSFLLEDGVANMAVELLPLFQNLIIKCGELGVLVAMRISGEMASSSLWTSRRSDPAKRLILAHGRNAELVVLKHFPPLDLPKNRINNVTGAGDSLVGALLANLVQRPTAFGDPVALDHIIHEGQQAAVLSLQSDHAVSPLLSKHPAQ